MHADDGGWEPWQGWPQRSLDAVMAVADRKVYFANQCLHGILPGCGASRSGGRAERSSTGFAQVFPVVIPNMLWIDGEVRPDIVVFPPDGVQEVEPITARQRSPARRARDAGTVGSRSDRYVM